MLSIKNKLRIAIITAIISTLIVFASSKLPSAPNLPSNTVTLTGAGASFPAPLYQTWFSNFNKQYPNIQFNYKPVGSGAGIQEFIKETVDFAASDDAITDEQITLVKRGVITLPLTARSIVIVYNVPDVVKLKLPRQVYTNIFLGKIKYWNDAAIIKANPGISFPKLPITVVYRSDGSTTTQVFTRHLSAISQEWATKIGSGKTVKWATGVGGKGSESPSAIVPQIPGSISYLEYPYATANNFKMASLENKLGQLIEPNISGFTQALNSVVLPSNLRVLIADPEGIDSYPIVAYTWLLAYKKYDNLDKVATLKYFLNWSLTERQKYSAELRYVPLPAKVINQVRNAVNQIL